MTDDSSGFLPHLGPALRLLRDERGLSQVELARAAALSKSQVSAFELARRRPSLRSLERLLAALGTDLAGLQRAVDRCRRHGRPRAGG